jgi:hypothetical protein
MSPTSSINVTAGCLLFSYYNYQGIRPRLHEVHGPLPALAGAPLLVIEIISHLARPFRCQSVCSGTLPRNYHQPEQHIPFLIPCL